VRSFALISCYFQTLRYLKPQQIYRRIWFRLIRPQVNKRPAPKLRTLSGIFKQPARRQVSLLDAETFFFLNKPGELLSLGWDGESQQFSKLWRYSQHYFDDLNANDSAQRIEWHRSLLLRWVAENPAGIGTGWEPYPTSLRITNWVKWYCAGNILPDVCLQSLAVQARWLNQRIEWHILGNHLFANAKALMFAGTFFSGEETNNWLAKGLKIASNEVLEQVLADGGNFERSPMYHAIFLEDILDLINLAHAFPGVVPEKQVADWQRTAGRMLGWLDAMTHPDSDIAFFNDAAIGIAPDPAELAAYAKRLNISFERADSGVSSKLRMTHFPQSGYVRVAASNALALLDVAPIGPDYLPGHAHADTLSFELSLFGQRVFVNGGTSEYGAGEIRQHERGTSAHNTVAINGENSSEVWGGFRVARRAYPRDLAIEEQDDVVAVSCAHDGYTRLKGKPIHNRSWLFSNRELIVEDKVRGRYQSAYAFFHLHPAIDISSNNLGGWILHLPEGQQVCLQVEIGDARLMHSYYAPEFGKRLKSRCLKIALESNGSRVRIDWNAEK